MAAGAAPRAARVAELCFTGARSLARLLRARKLSATELMQAFVAQIERVNPRVNAIVTFVPEQALKAARALDRRKSWDAPLAGLPIAYKDLLATKGFRTTFGSPIYAEHVPAENHLLVDRLSAAGAIILGKTNTPEFGAGSQTFNAVFGATRNPYDLSKTCGGSSGGAAVAVACGMLPFADGSDLAASLRNPGNFCNVVGFRPTPGRVPSWPALNGWDTLSTLGPIARTVEDTAFLLSAMAGPDARAPASISEPGTIFGRRLERDFRKARIAWSGDLGGLPVEPGVTTVLEAQRKVFRDLGCTIEEAAPDLSAATEAFHTLRSLGFLQRVGPLLREHRDKLKPTVIWNVEQGLRLTPEQITRAQALRTEVFHRLRAFLERYDFLLCPVNQVLPFPVEVEYPTEIAGVKMDNYIDWMKSCYYISVASHPAISVPAGFTPEGLPVGLQIVGRYRDDFGVLQLAHAFERATGFWRRRPSVVE
ncbi:MAG: amidase [Betaproteobacteria bacterium]|nr:amidase [Betaproteobacteria bacterium]